MIGTRTMGTEILNVHGKYVPHFVIPIMGDGSCLFRALSYVMYDTQNLAYTVRREIIDHVVSNWPQYAVATHDMVGDNYDSPDAYWNEMSQPYTFGGLCELIAASNIYGYTFEVYRNGELFTCCGGMDRPARRLRFSADLSSGHFDAYVPKIPMGWYHRVSPYNPRTLRQNLPRTAG